MPAPQLTDDLLARAWARIAQPEWHTTLAETKLAAIRWGRVVIEANRLAGGRSHAVPAAAGSAPPPTPTAHQPTLPRHPPEACDRKRAAAGDRDDV